MPLFDVKAPNGKVYRVNAPRGASIDDAIAYVKAMLEPEQAPEEEMPFPKEEAGFFGALGESLTDPIRYGAESAAFAANQTPETRAALLKAGESQYAPDAQFGQGHNWEAFKNLAGRSAGQMLAPLAVGAATSAVATPIAGIAAGFGTSAAQYENQNILDQAQRQQQAIDQGRAPEEFDLGRSLIASGLQAGLDVAEVGVIGKLLGKFPMAKALINGDREATTLLTNALEQGNVTFTGKVMKGVAGNIAFEIPQEIGQQALTLWQSHQPLDDENAIKEYADAAVGAFVLGGTIGGVAGGAGYFTRNKGNNPLTSAETPDEAESGELPPELRGLSGSGIRGLNVTLPEAQIPSFTPIDQGPPLTLNPLPPDETGGDEGAPPPNEPPGGGGGGAPSGLAALIARQNNQGYNLSRLPQPSVNFPYTPGTTPGTLPAGVNAAMPEGVSVGIDISTQLAKLAEAEAKRKEAEAEAKAAEAALRQGNTNGNNTGSSQSAGKPAGGTSGAGTNVPPPTENPEGGGSGKPKSEGVDATGADAQGTLFGEPNGNAPLGGKPKILSGAEADAAAMSAIEANDGVVDMAAITQAVGSNPKAVAAVNRLKKKKILANSVDDSHAEGTLATVARNNRIIDERSAATPKSEANNAFEDDEITDLGEPAPETITLDDGRVIDKETGEVMGQNEGPAPEGNYTPNVSTQFQTEQAPESPAAGTPKLTGAAKFRADLEASISFLRSLGAETAPGQWKSFINHRLGLNLEDGYANALLDRMREQGIVRNKMGKLSFNEAPRGTSTNATPSATPTTPAAPAAAPSTPSAARPSTPTTPTAAAAAPAAAAPSTPSAPTAAAPSTPSAPAAAPAGPPKVKVTTKIGVPKIPKAGKDINGVKAIVDSVLSGWKNAPEVGVFQSIADLPANIRGRVPSNAKGFHINGKVFIIADNAKSDSGIRATLFHEALGHAGLRGKFGTELNKMLYDMHKTHRGIREAADAWMKRNPNAYTNLSKEDRISMAVEEIIAEHSEHGDTRTIWTSYGLNKIAALVRSFLRQLGIVRAYSTNDIANIVRQAHEHIIEGPGGPGGGVKTATTTGTPKAKAPIQFQRGENKVNGPYSLKPIPPLSTDNPGGEWLVNQRKKAASYGRKASGAPKAFGAVTASYDGTVTLPVSLLKNIRGVEDEQNNVRPDSLKSLVEHMGENNRLPLGPFTDEEYPPFITVDQDGTPFVNEGNHRIMAAAKLGWDYLPVRIRYFSGGERADGILKPSTIKEKYGATEGDIQFQLDKAIDSLGLPVYPTEAGQKNFLNKWGKVKPIVRDAAGAVLRLYHGSFTSGIKALRSPIQRKQEDERISTMLGTHLAPDPKISDKFAFDIGAVTSLKDSTKQNPYLSGQAAIEGGVVYPVYARGKMLDLRTNDRNGFDDAHVAHAVIEHSMTPEYVAKTIRINDGSDVDEDQIRYLMRWWKESADKNTLYADPPDYVKDNVPIRYQYLTKRKFLSDMTTAYVQYGNLETNEQETLDVVNDFILNSGYDGIIYTNTNSFETEDASNLDSYIIFHSRDMKSAMGNTGAFSEKDNMQFQAASMFDSAAEAWDSIPTFNNKTVEKFLGFLEKLPGWFKRATFGMMSLSHIAETFKGHPMGAAVSRVENILNRRASKLDRRRNVLIQNLEKWNKIAIAHKDKLNEFFDIANGTTVDQIEFLKKGPDGKYVFDEDAPESDLKRRFLALPEALQKTYMELRDSYGDMSEELINRISSAVSDDSVARKLRNDYEKNRLQVYLPLFRSGDYWLSYFHDGENVTRSFENPRARRKAQKQMEEKGATEFDTYERLNDRLNERAQPPAGFVAEVITELRANGATQDMIDSVYETYMSYVPAQSIRQMFREREGVPGFEPDVFQAYANVATKMTNQLNNLEFAVSLDDATAAVNDAARLSTGASRTTAELGAAASNVVKQVEFIRNPTNSSLVDGASYWSYMWNIAGNVSSGIVNATQLGLVVYPILGGKYGFGKTFTAMENASKMFFDGGRDTRGSEFLPDFTFYKDSLSPELKDLFETAMDRSAIRSSSGQMLSEMRNSSTEDYTGLKAKVSHGLGFVFQNTERYNREVTLLAAYQLAKDTGMGHDAAVNEAIRVINEAHGTALPETGPRFFQKGLGKVAFTFKRFAQAQIYLLQKLFRTSFSNEDELTRDMARQQLLGIYAMSYMFSGMQGMPLFGAAEMLANMLFGDEDEPYDLNEKVRGAVGDLGYKGPINKLFNIDIAARTGFNGMVWRDDSKRAAEIGATLYAAEHVFGPAYGIARGFEQGAKQINQGDWYRGLESMTPSVIRNGLKGMRYAVEGATNKDGVKIVEDVNAYNAFMQIAGFTPADLAAARERAGVMKEAERKITQRRSSLLDRLDGALQNGDYSGALDIREEIDEFNSKHPQKGVKITKDTIKASRKGKREKENNAVDGVYLPDAMREELVESYGD